jgi:hypothetical protein
VKAINPKLRACLIVGGLALLAIGALVQWVPMMAIGVGAVLVAVADRGI